MTVDDHHDHDHHDHDHHHDHDDHFDHRGPPGRRGARPGGDRRAARAVARAVAGLELASLPAVESRLLARLVPAGRAGPLHRSVPETAAPRPTGPDDVVLDVGIDVGGGIVRPDRGLVAAWGVTPERIWRAAVANLDRLPDPTVVTVQRQPVRLQVLAGGPWTSGRVLLAHRLPVDPSSPVWVAAPCDDLLVVADRPGPAPAAEPPLGGARWTGPLLALAGRLAAAAPRPLPLRPIDPRALSSFPSQWFLE